MNDKRIPLEKEELTHKKKSKAKGLPRSKHKHSYETVLLTKYYHHHSFKTGAPKVTETVSPTKVCTICGRIDLIDTDPKYYTEDPAYGLPIPVWKTHLSEEALKLPKWYAHDFWDKFAYKGE